MTVRPNYYGEEAEHSLAKAGEEGNYVNISANSIARAQVFATLEVAAAVDRLVEQMKA